MNNQCYSILIIQMSKNKIKLDILKILQDIISIDTSYPPGHSLQLSKYIKLNTKKSGLIFRTHSKDINKPNIVLRNFNKTNSKSLVFNCHIDTVKPIIDDWKTNPYLLKIKKKYCYWIRCR